MSRLSGLSAQDRIRARDMTVQAAALCLHRKAEMHYTEGGDRWQGIDGHRKAWRGEIPNWADCSAFVTWCLWNGLDHFHIGDIVNGERWQAGYTGTMLDHGVSVGTRNMQRGDAVIYGDAAPGFHTALHVGGGMVISHGHEGAPDFLRFDQMGQTILDVKRYI